MRNAALLVAASALAASACVSLKRSPEARYFVLRSVAEAPAAATPAPAAPAAADAQEPLLGLLPARLPEALSRPQLVTVVSPGELRVDPLRRWAEPLDEGVTRTLRVNLAALLPRWRVLRSPWPVATPLRARLAVELQAFGPQASGTVRLDGSYELLDPREEHSLARRRFSLERPGPAGDDGAAVQAMSELLGDLSREVAATAESLPAARPAAGR